MDLDEFKNKINQKEQSLTVKIKETKELKEAVHDYLKICKDMI